MNLVLLQTLTVVGAHGVACLRDLTGRYAFASISVATAVAARRSLDLNAF